MSYDVHLRNAVAANGFEQRHSPRAVAANGFEACLMMLISEMLWPATDSKMHIPRSAVAATRRDDLKPKGRIKTSDSSSPSSSSYSSS